MMAGPRGAGNGLLLAHPSHRAETGGERAESKRRVVAIGRWRDPEFDW